MRDFENFLRQVKAESQRVRSLAKKSPTELEKSILIIKRVCQNFNKPECDALVYCIRDSDLRAHWMWEYVFIWYDMCNEKSDFCLTILRILIVNNEMSEMKLNNPTFYYYGNFFLWSYNNWALRLHTPEGINARINLLEMNYRIGELIVCEGISEDILITLSEMNQDDYRDSLNSIYNNTDIINKIRDCDNVKLSNNVAELMSYVPD